MAKDASATTDNRPDTDGRSETADRILDLVQERIQRRGYNAVSYGDLAEDLDLTTAAIHYHFPSKADMVEALVRRYRQQSAAMRKALLEEHDTLVGRLEEYVQRFSSPLRRGGLCLCGVLAADESTLPEEFQQEVRQFFEEHENWLAEVIETGVTDGGNLQGCDTPRDVARVFLATIEGAMLTSPDRSPEAYTETLQLLVDSIA